MTAEDRQPHLVTGIWIDGASRPATSGEEFVVHDPATGSEITAIASAGPQDVELAVRSSRRAQASWSNVAPNDRARVLRRVAELIRDRADILADIESLDTGKPLSQARIDVAVAADYFEFYSGAADKIYGSTIPLPGSRFAATFREPIGVSGHIVPWNYPLQISARTVAPSLAAGNGAVLKPAEEAPLTPLLLGKIVSAAGAPDGLLNVVPGIGEVAGAALAASDEIDHLSFTGGGATGRLVMAALAQNLKPSTMELGGKSPSLVLDDADLDRAVPVITKALVQNSGQTCSAGSRVIVAQELHDELVARLQQRFDNIRLGAGRDDPDMGPVITGEQHAQVLASIKQAVEEGARVACGGSAVTLDRAKGWFIEPTLLTGVASRMAVAQQEVFGPVLAVLSASSEAEAIEIANGTELGLIAAVWTSSVDRALRVARQLDCGQVFINSYGAGGGVALPFGGVRKSGFGREKGLEALHEYTRTKVVTFEVSDDAV